ncbi:MAG TPA: class F sortase [Candidatus Limnocylindrales bacterium]|nr:class F sortase [Candidatus Limnocylindrales bacterium]
MKKILFILLIAVFSFFGIKTGLSVSHQPVVQDRIAENNVDENQIDVPPVVQEKKIEAGMPKRLAIPKIKIDTAVEAAGLDEQKKPILPDDPDNVVWYSLGTRPGNKGSAVISGHFDKVNGSPAVFWDLKKLDAGDEISVTDADGNEFSYSVIKKVEYEFDKVPLQEIYAATSDKSLLNLITCSGTWNNKTKLYSTRTVVYAEAREK